MFWIGLVLGTAVGVFLMGLVVQRKLAEQRDASFKLGRELGTGEGYKLRDKELRQAYSARGKKGWATKRTKAGGGAWVGGRHTSGAGFTKDMEKYSEAAALGWRILRVAPKQLLTNATLDLVRRTISHQNVVLTTYPPNGVDL